MPAGSEGDTIALESPRSPHRATGGPTAARRPRADYLVSHAENDSVLECFRRSRSTLGRFPLLGPFNLGRTRPTGLAYSPERGLIAVATRSGSIHLVELRVADRTDAFRHGRCLVATSGR